MCRWDDRMSAVVPEEEEIFYALGMLHSTRRSESHVFDNLNKQILEFCENNGIKMKQYLAHYESKEDWMKHYGSKWDTFQQRKASFDPRMILSPAQNIFTTSHLSPLTSHLINYYFVEFITSFFFFFK